MNSNLPTIPANIEAEQAVLGGALLNPTSWDLVADRLRVSDFYRREHRAIYRAITALDAESTPFDAVVVWEWLKANGEDVGLDYLTTLVNNTPSSANIASHAEIVRNKGIERALLTAASQITQLAHSEGDTKAKLDKAQQLVGEIAQEHVTAGPVMVGTIIPKVLDEIEANMKSAGGLLGLSTGFSDLDRLTSGLQPSDLVIVAGRPSMGKTSFALNIAEDVALSGHAVLVFSMEMSASQLVQRSIASVGRLPFQALRTGKLDEDGWRRCTVATGQLNASKLMIDESPALSVMDIRARARRVHRERPLSLIVVDYLQLMQGEGENRNAEISEISRGLKALAKELKIPLIALSQLNRGVEQRACKRPVMSDLRESGAIEQDADVIAFIYRDEVYNPDSDAKGMAEIIIGKQRNGPTGMVRLTFSGQSCRFENYGGPEIVSQKVRPIRQKWAGGFDD